MVEVVKLGDGAEARFQHLDIGLSGDRLDVVGGRRERETIHRIAPGPETVRRVASPLRKAGHGALERVRMQVADRRDADPAALVAGFSGRVELDRADRRAVDPDPNVRGPALRRQRPLEMQRRHRPACA